MSSAALNLSSDPVSEFHQAMADAGILSDEVPIADGQLHRFKADGDKTGSKNGWYILFNDGNPAGSFGSWKYGVNETWSLKNYKDFTPQQKAEYAKQMAQAKTEREKAQAVAHKEARSAALRLWSEASPETGNHKYLQDKGVQAYKIRSNGADLLIPLRDSGGTLHSIQTIDEHGKKLFLSGGAIRGHYFGIGKPNGKMVIAEGYSTAASIYESTGLAVAVAFNSGNLTQVAKALRGKYPDIEIIIAGDNDTQTEGNPGKSKATEAAKAVNGRLVIPEFKDKSNGATDFNDLHLLEGLESVKEQINNDMSVLSVDEWPDPESVHHSLRPVEALPLSIIPEPLRGWVEDTCYRMQCPLDFVATASIVMAGSVIGAGCGVKPKRLDDWVVIPNLWGGAVGRPSVVLKSPAIEQALSPLVKLEMAAKEDHESECDIYEVELAGYRAMKDAAQADMKKAYSGKKNDGQTLEDAKHFLRALEKPDEPAWKRYKTSDATVEKMAVLLSENPRGMLLERDELVGLLASWDREDKQTDRAFYLEAWNGYGSYTSDRIGRGTTYTENMCVSIFGGIQPAKLLKYLQQATSGYQNDGLIQRLQLLVYPDEPKQWKLVDQFPNREAKDRFTEIIKKLSEMDFTEYGAIQDEYDKYPCFRFSNEAQEVFFDWWTELQTVKLQQDDDPIMIEHLGKFRSLFPSLALIFHLIDIADGNTRGGISLEATKKAAAWCDYLESHARRIYGYVSDIGIKAAENLLTKITNGKVQDEFTVRDIYRNQWHLLNDREIVQKACDELVDAGCIREEEIKGSFGAGRGKTIYLINPKLEVTHG